MDFKKIAVGGSAANPPHIGHLSLIEALIHCRLFDMVIWVPSGTRPDKRFGIEPDHRVAMTELTFPSILRVRSGTTLVIKYDDIYKNDTPTINRLETLQKQYPHSDITWYTGSDSVRPQKKYGQRCEIEAVWDRGEELFQKWNFLILPRRGYKQPHNLPANFKILNVKLPDTASSTIRKMIQKNQPFEHLLTAEVAEYIKRFDLYQGVKKHE
ncbi:MAG: nicotinate-nicotinamide nucleotide adenylyltransferase [Candidatus Buchananbacteria bacterium]|nr:nicotinate-nicotinamide nucleotide adenylyltransferase [Candidatus Buchananbacteria bacterium]